MGFQPNNRNIKRQGGNRTKWFFQRNMECIDRVDAIIKSGNTVTALQKKTKDNSAQNDVTLSEVEVLSRLKPINPLNRNSQTSNLSDV